MRRFVFTLLSALSLVLFAVTCMLWPRTYRTFDRVAWNYRVGTQPADPGVRRYFSTCFISPPGFARLFWGYSYRMHGEPLPSSQDIVSDYQNDPQRGGGIGGGDSILNGYGFYYCRVPNVGGETT